MASAAQIHANQQNSQLSTGPRTPEGKLASSRNAIKHGLTGQTIVLPGEDTKAYNGFHDRLFADFAPNGSQEEILVQTLCDVQWQLERIHSIEANLIALAHFEDIPANLAAIEDPDQRNAMITAYGYQKREKELRNLQREQNRLQRALFRALQDLNALQDKRHATAQNSFLSFTGTPEEIGFVSPEPETNVEAASEPFAPLRDECTSAETDVQYRFRHAESVT